MERGHLRGRISLFPSRSTRCSSSRFVSLNRKQRNAARMIQQLLCDAAGDYQYDALTLQAAKDAGLRINLLSAFYEYAGLGGQPLETAQERFETRSLEEYWAQMDRLTTGLDATQSLGVVAHSIRAVGIDKIKVSEEPLRVCVCLYVFCGYVIVKVPQTP